MRYVPIEVRLFIITIIVSSVGLTMMFGLSDFTMGTVLMALLFSVPSAFCALIISLILALVRSTQNKGELEFGVKRAKKLTRIEEIILLVILIPIASRALYFVNGGYINDSLGSTELRGLRELILVICLGITSVYIVIYLLYSRLIAK